MANLFGNYNIPQQQDSSNVPLSATASAAERAQRSVFVGNIPYDATEEQLREVFVQAGPVVSFRLLPIHALNEITYLVTFDCNDKIYDKLWKMYRASYLDISGTIGIVLVYDRETGKPKGYGFCEYQDVETAQSAMRNLNNYDFNGRPLRVGVAAGEQSKDEGKAMQQALGGQIVESPYGEPVEPEKAPEAISKAVASLPPEQMFELMKQMKLCIQNNPNEARNMLLQNPQLAYALLQAQIVMKIVDPQVAMSMLYRDDSLPLVNVTAANTTPKPSVSTPASMVGGVRGPQGMPGPLGSMGQGFLGMNIGPMSAPVRPDMMMMRPNVPPGDVGEAGRFPQPNSGPGPGGRMPGPASGPGMVPNQRPSGPQPPNPLPGGPAGSSGAGPSTNGATNISAQDQEKAALIMQVLQLTDEQIALLPQEQRQSILILKQQIKSG